MPQTRKQRAESQARRIERMAKASYSAFAAESGPMKIMPFEELAAPSQDVWRNVARASASVFTERKPRHGLNHDNLVRG